MTHPVHLGIALLLASAGLASAGPTELSQRQLDLVTAGSSGPAPNGGAIVGNGSKAVLVSSGEVILDGEAQSAAAALNAVNSSESTVANGVNIFDGSVAGEAALEGAVFNVDQSNMVVQDQRRLSSLPSYERGANTEFSVMESGSSSSASTNSVFDEVTDLEQTIVLDQAVTDGGFSQNGSPTVGVHVDGIVDIGDSFVVDGVVDVEVNAPSATNSIGVVFNGEIDYQVEGGQVTIDTGGVVVDWTLPQLGIEFDAMGCVAINGDCTINGSREESTTTTSDHSTLYTVDETSSSESTYSKSTVDVTQAAFELNDAQAEYIVVDDSEVDVTATYLLSLSGSSQSSLRGLNVVNAAGSAVANGVNIAKQGVGTIQGAEGPTYNLNQINSINHSR